MAISQHQETGLGLTGDVQCRHNANSDPNFTGNLVCMYTSYLYGHAVSHQGQQGEDDVGDYEQGQGLSQNPPTTHSDKVHLDSIHLDVKETWA